MGSFSLVHWLVFGIVAILLLGGGRFSNLMGDVAKGIKNFKKGMAEEDETVQAGRIEAQKSARPAFETEAERVREERP
jgi:sec-independent protein translocase protein TatA